MLFKDPLAQRRWRNFRENRRAYWSLIIFSILFGISIFAELIANDKPLLVSFKGEYFTPAFKFYPETAFGGEFETQADFRDPVVQCLIKTDAADFDLCLDEPERGIEEGDGGWMLWPMIPYHYKTVVKGRPRAPAPPDGSNILGTDDQSRDVAARLLYGFRVSVLFGLILTVLSTIVGVFAGAVQGYFGGRIDLFFQRFIEIWSATPALYIIMIVAAVITPSFWVLLMVLLLFSWTALVGVVRAEFLRARNFEYIQAARALGVSNPVIMWRHMLPNAMVATITMMPFVLTGAIGTLASLDFLGFGLPPGSPSLGELTLQGQNNLQAPWLGFTGFFAFAIMLSLLVFIFEGVRDAFDPRKTFS